MWCSAASVGAEDDTGMSGKKRNEIYEKGLKLLRLGQNEAALKCFLQSLKGFEQDNTFAFLPQCLRSVSITYGSTLQHTGHNSL